MLSAGFGKLIDQKRGGIPEGLIEMSGYGAQQFARLGQNGQLAGLRTNLLADQSRVLPLVIAALPVDKPQSEGPYGLGQSAHHQGGNGAGIQPPAQEHTQGHVTNQPQFNSLAEGLL